MAGLSTFAGSRRARRASNFIGLAFLHSAASALIGGVGRDAAFIADRPVRPALSVYDGHQGPFANGAHRCVRSAVT